MIASPTRARESRIGSCARLVPVRETVRCLVLSLILLPTAECASSQCNAAPTPTYPVVTVVDGATGAPICDASLVVVETVYNVNTGDASEMPVGEAS